MFNLQTGLKWHILIIQEGRDMEGFYAIAFAALTAIPDALYPEIF